MGNTVEFTSSANNVSRQESNSNNNNSRCNYNNYQWGNYRGSRGRGRGCGRNNNGPRCQVFGIPGHSALNCRNRFNHAYQAEENRSGKSVTMGNYNPDTTWYLDTRATDHLSSDLDRLTMQDRYHGKDQVQVANGAGLSILHIGHSKIPS